MYPPCPEAQAFTITDDRYPRSRLRGGDGPGLLLSVQIRRTIARHRAQPSKVYSSRLCRRAGCRRQHSVRVGRPMKLAQSRSDQRGSHWHLGAPSDGPRTYGGAGVGRAIFAATRLGGRFMPEILSTSGSRHAAIHNSHERPRWPIRRHQGQTARRPSAATARGEASEAGKHAPRMPRDTTPAATRCERTQRARPTRGTAGVNKPRDETNPKRTGARATHRQRSGSRASHSNSPPRSSPARRDDWPRGGLGRDGSSTSNRRA